MRLLASIVYSPHSWAAAKPIPRTRLPQPFRQSSSSTRYLLRTPAASAHREVPTPIVFVSSSTWDPPSAKGMSTASSWFSQRGFTCLELDLARPSGNVSSQELMKHYESEVASHIRLLSIPFAPVIIARRAGALIAQSYISSYPATALLLISPPPADAVLPRTLLPTPLPEFNFETKFPCAVMCTKHERPALEAANRLWKDPGVDKIVVKDDEAVMGHEGLMEIEQWMDELGI
ncbi:uncharacterized protein BXZ73DRAFT_105616 [Epithele typhae]|uniref:uncharacterized protein n=1 Tax=Epithele typhae TaxID=378194 RepID=UPI002008979F|nr:uncharacterized protein BXZ73DRAFT_105616 [Epithele typhae]KAH9917144.1 hypothetical protein BXZ73DRAFT_105616 [Epithele typhae]